MHERPKLVYRNVLRGEDRLRMAAVVYDMRVNRRMLWREIAEATGISLHKACIIHTTIPYDHFSKYLEENGNG